jgi:prenyltransferase beta subunit
MVLNNSVDLPTFEELISKKGSIVNFLKRDCKAEKGFYGQLPEIYKPATATSATILLCLYYTGKLSKNEKRKWLEEILEFQYNDGSFCKISGKKSVWSTSWAVWVFFESLEGNKQLPEVEKALEWLLSSQNREDGGWGYDKRTPSRPFYTFYAMRAIKAAYKKTKRKLLRNKMKKAIKYIINSQDPNEIGKWSYTKGSSEFLADTAMAIMVLIEEKRNFPDLIDEEIIKIGISRLIKWLSIKKKWRCTLTESAYTFHINFFTPALLILFLEFGEKPESPICLELVSWFKNNLINSKGWCGDLEKQDKTEPYSWSTALGLLAVHIWYEKLRKQSRLQLADELHITHSKKPVSRLSNRIIKDYNKLKKDLEKLKKSNEKKNFLIMGLLGVCLFLVSYITKIPQYVVNILLGISISNFVVSFIISIPILVLQLIIQWYWRRKS